MLKEALESVVKTVTLSYTKAKDAATLLRSKLSPRGEMIVDDRTNTLLLSDTKDKLDLIEKLITVVDTPTPQVSIEARIVEATSNFVKNLGIQWGFKGIADPFYGNQTSLQFPNKILVDGALIPQGEVTKGISGPLGGYAGERVIPAQRTTPEALEVQQMLSQMLRSGCQACVMEVSSHALDQKRVHGLEFDVGIFTNLTRDHLDYHGSMEDYFEAKKILFVGIDGLPTPDGGVMAVLQGRIGVTFIYPTGGKQAIDWAKLILTKAVVPPLWVELPFSTVDPTHAQAICDQFNCPAKSGSAAPAATAASK